MEQLAAGLRWIGLEPRSQLIGDQDQWIGTSAPLLQARLGLCSRPDLPKLPGGAKPGQESRDRHGAHLWGRRRCQRAPKSPGVDKSFAKGRDFAAWVGRVPCQFSTGGRTVLGRITKRGSRYLRMLFVQAAKVSTMRPNRWPAFSFGAWLADVAGRMSPNKVAIALEIGRAHVGIQSLA